jgi:hypothetical protein
VFALDPQDHITHLNGRMTDELGYHRYAYQPGVVPPTEVEAFFRLSPHAKVVLDLEHSPRPVMFLASGNGLGHRAHVVVARDMGDLTWPAYLARLRVTAYDEARTYVQKAFQPLRDAIHAAYDDRWRRRPFDRPQQAADDQ